MEEINKAYATFRERDRIASLGGGVEKIEKQHESGKMTARERIEMLLDKGTFVELDKLMVHRCTNYGMDKNKIPGDGIVSGYGKIDGRQVFVYVLKVMLRLANQPVISTSSTCSPSAFSCSLVTALPYVGFSLIRASL